VGSVQVTVRPIGNHHHDEGFGPAMKMIGFRDSAQMKEIMAQKTGVADPGFLWFSGLGCMERA
jgi:hypothetical protein